MGPLRYTAKCDPFLSLDCAPTPSTWHNPRKGRHQILPSGNLGIQDGLIFVGGSGGAHEELLNQIVKHAPSIFTSNRPVFMPDSYSDILKLRLDSNVIFFEEVAPSRYRDGKKDGP